MAAGRARKTRLLCRHDRTYEPPRFPSRRVVPARRPRSRLKSSTGEAARRLRAGTRERLRAGGLPVNPPDRYSCSRSSGPGAPRRLAIRRNAKASRSPDIVGKPPMKRFSAAYGDSRQIVGADRDNAIPRSIALHITNGCFGGGGYHWRTRPRYPNPVHILTAVSTKAAFIATSRAGHARKPPLVVSHFEAASNAAMPAVALFLPGLENSTQADFPVVAAILSRAGLGGKREGLSVIAVILS